MFGVFDGWPDRRHDRRWDGVATGDRFESESAAWRQDRHQGTGVDLPHPAALGEPDNCRRQPDRRINLVRCGELTGGDRCPDCLGHDGAEDLADVHLLGGVMDRGDDG